MTDRADAGLRRQVESFAGQLNATLRAALGLGFDPLRTVLADRRFAVTTAPTGLDLLAGGAVVLRLSIRFECAWDREQQFLAIDSSEFHVFAASERTPFLRYEFIRSQAPGLPAAHLHVHASRDSVVHALMSGGSSTERAARRRSRESAVPSLRDLHLPVGGRRFRPAVEDVLEMLVEEFDIDVEIGWRELLANGRAERRRAQALSVVRDDPEGAAGLLRSLGYTVHRPLDGAPSRTERRFREL